MRKWLFLLAIVTAGPTLGWALYAATLEPGAVAQTQKQNSGPPAVPVTAGTAEARDMPVYVRGIGSVQAFNTVAVKSRADGQIVKVDFTEGQEVKAGDLLFEIDPRPYQAALAAGRRQPAEGPGPARQRRSRSEARRGAGRRTAIQTRQAYDQQKARSAQIQASIKVDQAHDRRGAAQSRLHQYPLADRRTHRRAARRCRQPRPRHATIPASSRSPSFARSS